MFLLFALTAEGMGEVLTAGLRLLLCEKKLCKIFKTKFYTRYRF